MKFKKCKFCGAVVPIEVKGCTSCGSSFKSLSEIKKIIGRRWLTNKHPKRPF